MPWPAPSSRTLRQCHLGCGLPLIALAIWFGVIDRLPFGEGRCSSCGLEPSIIAVHPATAAWLGALIACVAAGRRQLREGTCAPGRITLGALAAAALFVLASLIWHPLFDLPGLAALIAGIVAVPVALVWWTLQGVAWWRREAQDESELARRYGRALMAAWVSLTLVLPAMYAYVWADRVNWLVF